MAGTKQTKARQAPGTTPTMSAGRRPVRRTESRAAIEAEIAMLNEKLKRDLLELQAQAARLVPQAR
jgi:hypothetical protein